MEKKKYNSTGQYKHALQLAASSGLVLQFRGSEDRMSNGIHGEKIQIQKYQKAFIEP